MNLNKDKIRHSFLYAALWTEELDGKHNVEDFLPSSVDKANTIIDIFLERAPKEALKTYCDHFNSGALKEDPESQLGHDLWLSINGHGAGFFDHSFLGGVEDVLQNVCRDMRWEGDKPGYINQVWVNELGHILIE